MGNIKIERDNVILNINEEDLKQYEARGYAKIGATKKVAPKDLEKEITKLSKANEKLIADNEELSKTNEKLIADNEELSKANEKLIADIEELKKKIK